MIRAVIVDDESKGRATLKKLCEKYCKGVKVVGMADSVKGAKEVIELHEPDVVFLDVRMPMGDGFTLLEAYENVPFEVVFTTAHDEYALKAFKFSATDYLLKPINISELKKAVEKLKKRKAATTPQPNLLNTLKENVRENSFTKLALPTLEGYIFVKKDNIIRCEANGNYTSFRIDGSENLLITKTLKYYDDILSEFTFFRIHKSHLINLNYVRKFIKGRQGAVEMTNGDVVEVSSRRRDDLLKQLISLK